MRRDFLIALIVVCNIGAGACLAQSPSAQNNAQSPPVTDQSIDQVQSDTEDLSKQPIPDKDVLLLRELDRIDGEVARATQVQQKANAYKYDQSYYTGVTDRIVKQSKVLAQVDCQNNLPKYQYAMQSYSRAYSDFFNYLNNMGDVDVTSIAVQPSGRDPVAQCNDAKVRTSSQEYQDSQNEVLNRVQKALSDYLASQTNIGAAETKYIDALKKRRAAVQDKLNSSQPALQIGSNLWLLLLILGTACVMTILGIKLFSPELQMEWVASGQVIQFVTVMILLSVILALGLSSILKENTLGTLLGGIAGYVLAQGVGRSAARDVARTAAAAAAPGPVQPQQPPAAQV